MDEQRVSLLESQSKKDKAAYNTGAVRQANDIELFDKQVVDLAASKDKLK